MKTEIAIEQTDVKKHILSEQYGYYGFMRKKERLYYLDFFTHTFLL